MRVNRNCLLSCVVVAGVIAISSGCGSKSEPSAADLVQSAPPNVVWIVLDACRADHLSAYGYHRPTSPHIDGLADRGILFERNYAQGPNTPQSVENYMTGRYSAVAYHYAGAMGDWFLRTPPPGESLVSTIFHENGYNTAMFSASPWYIEESRLAKSFDLFRPLRHGPDAPGTTWRQRNPELFAWIAGEHDEPFFLYVHSLDTHGPRYANNTTATWLDPGFPAERDAQLRAWQDDRFAPADQARLIDLYDGGVQFADASVGEILAALGDAGLSESTIVIIGSDHGELLGEDGHTISHPPWDSHDELLHVPLVIAGPGVPENVRIEATTQNADIVPTLVELLKLKTAATFNGRSLVPAWESDTEIHEYAVARTLGASLADEPGRVVIFDDLKFHFAPSVSEDELAMLPPGRREDVVYAMPDTAADRRTVAPPGSASERAQRILHGELDPLWAGVQARPQEIPPWFRLQLGTPYNNEAVAGELSGHDNLWSRHPTRFANDSNNDAIYVARPVTESAPGLIFVRSVPNGEYRVSAYSVTLPADPPRGASFRYVFPKLDNTPRTVGIPAPARGETTESWLELGTVRITDGRLELWVDAGHQGDDTVIGHLVFTQTGAEADIDEFEERRQQMEALGYVQ